MVHGYHVVFVTDGAWLPNDPRGSWSDFVAAWELFYFGKSAKKIPTGSLLTDPHLAKQRSQFQHSLKYPAVQLTNALIAAVAAGFEKSLSKYGVTIWACSILPEHIHLVLARTGKSCEVMVNFLKGEATRELNRQLLHPLAAHSESGRTPQPWGRKHWQVFLDTTQAIDSAIRYVNDNPGKEGKPRQQWTFISPFHGVDSNIVSYPD